jgi:hypothetical protein
MLPPALNRQLQIEPDWIHAPIAVARTQVWMKMHICCETNCAADHGPRQRFSAIPLGRRVESLNTAAAGGNGGNASLMTLGI